MCYNVVAGMCRSVLVRISGLCPTIRGRRRPLSRSDESVPRAIQSHAIVFVPSDAVLGVRDGKAAVLAMLVDGIRCTNFLPRLMFAFGYIVPCADASVGAFEL